MPLRSSVSTWLEHRPRRRLISLPVMLRLTAAAHAQPSLFVAVDGEQTATRSPYAGLPNPSFGRLTLLFAHTSESDPSSNHVHALGADSYAGPVSDPIVQPTNTDNRIPETYTGEPPLPLEPALRFPPDPGLLIVPHLIDKPGESEYSNIRLQSVQLLSEFASDTPEGILFSSSNGRWKAPLTGAVLALELVAISRGLFVADECGQQILTKPGDTYALGDGDRFSFTPYFVTRLRAPAGRYSATFKLVDVGTGERRLEESGTFRFDCMVAPSIVNHGAHSADPAGSGSH
jgi:hypothetical protein